MAKKITLEIAQKMKERYAVLGTYAAVAKEFGISASTASRYIKEQSAIKTYDAYSGSTPSEIPGDVFTFSILTDAEAASYDAFMKEFYVF